MCIFLCRLWFILKIHGSFSSAVIFLALFFLPSHLIAASNFEKKPALQEMVNFPDAYKYKDLEPTFASSELTASHEEAEESFSEYVYKKMRKNSFYTYAYLGFFGGYHSLRLIENSYYLLAQKPLLADGFFVSSHLPEKEKDYFIYTARFSVITDVLSLLSIAMHPYRSTLYLARYHEVSSDDEQQKDIITEDLLEKSMQEQSAPRSFKSHLIRLAFHTTFSVLIAFDFGDSHRAMNYFISNFIGGEIKAYLSPLYAERISRNWKQHTVVSFGSPLFLDSSLQNSKEVVYQLKNPLNLWKNFSAVTLRYHL